MLNTKAWGVATMLMALVVVPAQAQKDPGAVDRMVDPLMETLQDGNGYIRDMFTQAADQMSEEEYAFMPTPEVRSFGQLLVHVARTNYIFCAAAKGETSSVSDDDATSATRDDILKLLANSFDYCDTAYRTASRNEDTVIEFMGKERSLTAVLNFRNYHALLHYGNVITYMRLRGKTPPSSQLN